MTGYTYERGISIGSQKKYIEQGTVIGHIERGTVIGYTIGSQKKYIKRATVIGYIHWFSKEVYQKGILLLNNQHPTHFSISI